jgi:hypothetical protein
LGSFTHIDPIAINAKPILMKQLLLDQSRRHLALACNFGLAGNVTDTSSMQVHVMPWPHVCLINGFLQENLQPATSHYVIGKSSAESICFCNEVDTEDSNAFRNTWKKCISMSRALSVFKRCS